MSEVATFRLGSKRAMDSKLITKHTVTSNHRLFSFTWVSKLDLWTVILCWQQPLIIIEHWLLIMVVLLNNYVPQAELFWCLRYWFLRRCHSYSCGWFATPCEWWASDNNFCCLVSPSNVINLHFMLYLKVITVISADKTETYNNIFHLLCSMFFKNKILIAVDLSLLYC